MQEEWLPDLARRFGGLDRLKGDGHARFLNSHVHAMVVGVGGVGSWAVEALARSGVGQITLVDMDHVAESNINRQIQADDSTLGQAKIQALANRIHSYFPGCRVNLVDAFLEAENARELINRFKASDSAFKVLLDCCDNVRAKVAMVVEASRQGLPLVLSGSAGGKTQPWMIQPADLRDTTNDPLLAKVRYQLRKAHGYTKDPKRKLGVPVFYSLEQVKKSEVCEPSAGLNCAGYGSVVTVTATMGMHMAAWALEQAHASWRKAISV